MTILYVTHDQEEALRLSDRIALLQPGPHRADRHRRDLYANPATRFVAEFIGDSDILGSEIVATTGTHADLRVGDAVVRGVPVHGAARPGIATLLLRPERINLARGTNEGLPVTVTDVTFLGNNFHVATITDRGEVLSVRLPFGHEAAMSLSRGETVRLTFDPASAHVFC